VTQLQTNIHRNPESVLIGPAVMLSNDAPHQTSMPVLSHLFQFYIVLCFLSGFYGNNLPPSHISCMVLAATIHHSGEPFD